MLEVGKSLRKTGSHIRGTLIAGLLVIMPLAVTFLILKFVFDFFDPLLKDLIEQFAPRYTPGMGIIALLIVIYLAGLVTRHVLGRRIIQLGHNIVDRVPVVSGVYRAARQATDVFSAVSARSNGRYSMVVLVEFPGNGLQSIGLVTGSMKDRDGNNLLAVYMPTSPFPTSGFLVIIPEDRVTPTDMPVDDAIKLIVSAGVVAPDQVITHAKPFHGVAYPPPWGVTVQPVEPSVQDQRPDNRASNQ